MRYVYQLQCRHTASDLVRMAGDWHPYGSEHVSPDEAFRALREVPREQYEWRDWQVVVRERLS